VPATPPGDDPRDQWSRGTPARHGRGADEYERDDPGTYEQPAPWGRQDPPSRGWQQPEQPTWRPADEPAWPQQPTAEPAWPERPGDESGWPRQPGDESGWPRQSGDERAWPRQSGDEPAWPQAAVDQSSAWAAGHNSSLDEPTALTPLVEPAPAAAAARAAEPTPSGSVPATPRTVALATAGISALLTFALAIGAMISHASYAVAVLAVQVLFVLAWTVATRPPAPRVVAGVGLAAAAAADLAAILADPVSLAPLAYVTAGAFVAGVVGQLTRPAGRVRVTESLGSTLAVTVGVVAFSSLVVLSRHPGGTQALMAGVLAAGVAVVVARLVDVVAPYPRLAPQVPRGGAGVVAGAMLGTGVAALAGALLDGLSTGPTAVAGLVAALVAVVVDLSIGYADAGRELAGEPPALWLARHMQGPLAAFALAAPAVYTATLLLL
jgi:hypothetical protein